MKFKRLVIRLLMANTALLLRILEGKQQMSKKQRDQLDKLADDGRKWLNIGRNE